MVYGETYTTISDCKSAVFSDASTIGVELEIYEYDYTTSTRQQTESELYHSTEFNCLIGKYI